MKFYLSLVLLISLFFNSFAQPVRHAILITFDGMRPEFYLDNSWPAPNLQAIKEAGVYAQKVIPVFPSQTFPNHTSMLTGALPASHGITFNTPFEPQGPTGRWNWFYKDIQTRTIWDALHDAHLVTAAVDWPVGVSGPIDFNYPCIWSIDSAVENISVIKSYTHPASLFDELQAEATGHIPSADINSEYLKTDEDNGRIAAYLFKKHHPAFLAVHLTGVDHAEHANGRNGPQVRAAVAAVDRVIGSIMEAVEREGLKDSTTILVMGDHGFVDIQAAIYPNVWLIGANIAVSGEHWKARFQSGSGSAFLHLHDPADSATLRKVRATIEGLPASVKKLFRIFSRAELAELGADPLAAFAISPVSGFAISGGTNGSWLQAAKQRGTHGQYPGNPDLATGFLGCGAGLKKGALIPVMQMPDLAPLIAALFQISFQSPDGILAPGFLRDSK